MNVLYQGEYLCLCRCASGEQQHFHIACAPSLVSWPAWSVRGFSELAQFIRLTSLKELPSAVRPAAELELREIIRKVLGNPLGFKKPCGHSPGLRLPLEILPTEREIVEQWQLFQHGETSVVNYRTRSGELVDIPLLPLRCGFVYRDQPFPSAAAPLAPAEWTRLTEAPARLMAPAELGIKWPGLAA